VLAYASNKPDSILSKRTQIEEASTASQDNDMQAVRMYLNLAIKSIDNIK
jgi:hypothetical protein